MLGDVRTAPLEPGSFDVVASVATLHHLPDPRVALARFAELTAPGGAVVVIGLARTASPVDRLWSLAGAGAHRVLLRRRTYWEHSAPTVWPPPHTYAEVRRAAQDALPGARWRRLVLWRSAIVWTKPSAVSDASGRAPDAPGT